MQVEIMKWFQGIFENFTEFFDVFFSFFTLFGEEMALIIIIPIIYWTMDKRLGKILGITIFSSVICNETIKNIAKIERPISNPDIRFVEEDNIFVNTIELKDSYSFPSGHSQNISSTMFTLSLHYNNKKLWIYSIILVLLVMMSRLYLGVHWPIDVIVGCLLGLIFACIMYIVHKQVNPNLYDYIYIGISILALLCLFVTRSSNTLKALGCLFGFSTGSLFESKFVNFDPKMNSTKKKVLRCAIGFCIILGLRIGLKSLFGLIGNFIILDFLRYFILIFIGIAIYPWLFKKINL